MLAPFSELASGAAQSAAQAAAIALVTVLICGPRAISWLGRRFREPNKSDSPRLAQLHAHKRATPTMGGLLILAGLLAAELILGDWSNRLLHIAVFVVGALATIGAIDDWIKLATPRPGLRPRTKLLAVGIVSTLAAVALYEVQRSSGSAGGVWLPGTNQSVTLGVWWIPFAVLVLVGSANAVNLTDGLDGLAAGCLAIAFAGLSVLCIVADSNAWAANLGMPAGIGGEELAVLAAAACGATLGFLWYNRRPARVFMGDTGALSLGGLLGMVALAGRLEVALVLIGAVFVAEAASVILQVGSFKLRRKRIFRCAPLHHHFQFLGWSERTTVTRFWWAGGVAALTTLALIGAGAMVDRIEPWERSDSGVTLPSAQRTASAGPLDRAER